MIEQEHDITRCECELDWRCGLHAHQPSPLELINDEWAQSERSDPSDRFDVEIYDHGAPMPYEKDSF